MGRLSEGTSFSVKVPRTMLLVTLRKNLQEHIQIVKEAKAGYERKLLAIYEAGVDILRDGRIPKVVEPYQLPVPKDHSKEYQDAIEMLEMSREDNVELGIMQFRALVKDEWEWSGGFYTTNSAYSGSAREKAPIYTIGS